MPKPTSQRLPIAISVIALCVACSGVTPAEAVRAAKTTFASNAGKVNGIKASKTPQPGQLLPLGSDGTFPATVLPAAPAGPRGPRGAEGSKGETGAAGAKGDAGPRGPSNILTANRGSIPLGGAGGMVEVAAFELPPGNWWVIGTGSLYYAGAGSSNASFFRCSLLIGSQQSAQTLAYLGPGNPAQPTYFPGSTLAGAFAVQTSRTIESTQRLSLRCGHDTALTGDPSAEQVSLTAVRAESVEAK